MTNFNLSFENEMKTSDKNHNLTLTKSLYTATDNITKRPPKITVRNGNAFFTNTTISGIFSNDVNGIIYVTTNSHIHFLNSTISNNIVSQSVVKVTSKSSLYLQNCIIENNNSTELSVIILSNSDGNFQSCEMKGNYGVNGGVLYASNVHGLASSNRNIFGTEDSYDADNEISIPNEDLTHTIYISDCLFTLNQAGDGGTLCLYFAVRVDIFNSKFLNNSGYNGGAIASNQNNVIQIQNCTFNGNTATRDGGCIFTEANTTVTFNQSLFEDNIARK